MIFNIYYYYFIYFEDEYLYTERELNYDVL